MCHDCLLFAAEGEDYVLTSETVTFLSNDSVNGMVQCVQINITDDDAYEEDELFTIRIDSAEPSSAVTIGSPSEVTKTIQDNTGKIDLTL